jgi:WXXGXW repeat (2 copies)
MKRIPRFAIAMSIAVAGALCVSVCRSGHVSLIPTVGAAVAGVQDQAPPDQTAPPDQNPADQGPDPASVNTAPSGPSYTTEAPPPADQSAEQPGQAPDDSSYAEMPTEQSTEAPPPLPDYDQPADPGDGYIWTPGYWAWGAGGYYWVPGAWVEPPYVGGLWTPGYWGFYGGRYLFYPGHWGLHIGFYGGINYGFGYVGFGYEGGYWNGGHFFYNRVYNNVNVRSIRNVYSYRAGNRGSYNRGGNNYNNNPRPSYRGGSGVQYRPQPSEGAAAHEPTAPRMNTQMQHEQTYGAVRGQYAAQNHGRPPTAAVSRPIPADHSSRSAPSSHGGSQSGSHHR